MVIGCYSLRSHWVARGRPDDEPGVDHVPATGRVVAHVLPIDPLEGVQHVTQQQLLGLRSCWRQGWARGHARGLCSGRAHDVSGRRRDGGRRGGRWRSIRIRSADGFREQIGHSGFARRCARAIATQRKQQREQRRLVVHRAS